MREVKECGVDAALTAHVRERIDGHDSQTKPFRWLLSAHLVRFTERTDHFGWLLILAGKLRSNQIITRFQNGALGC